MKKKKKLVLGSLVSSGVVVAVQQPNYAAEDLVQLGSYQSLVRKNVDYSHARNGLVHSSYICTIILQDVFWFGARGPKSL